MPKLTESEARKKIDKLTNHQQDPDAWCQQAPMIFAPYCDLPEIEVREFVEDKDHPAYGKPCGHCPVCGKSLGLVRGHDFPWIGDNEGDMFHIMTFFCTICESACQAPK